MSADKVFHINADGRLQRLSANASVFRVLSAALAQLRLRRRLVKFRISTALLVQRQLSDCIQLLVAVSGMISGLMVATGIGKEQFNVRCNRKI